MRLRLFGFMPALKAVWQGVSQSKCPLGWDPAAAGSRAGDGMARFVSEEKAADVSVHVRFIPNHKLRNHYNVNLKPLFRL